MARTAFVTGSAGFIGYHLAARLLAEDWRVIGLDAMTPYYDVRLKALRRDRLMAQAGYTHVEARLEEPGRLARIMAEERPEIVLHLAAQAGVRHSIEAPRSYLESNIQGTFELLEAARLHPPRHLLIASSSSAYGAGGEMPSRETQRADYPLSFYAATKKATESLAHAQSHIHCLPVTMFRFFTVYGPWGRPDMALFKFVRAIRAGEPIDIYGMGRMRRDFTYVDDLVAGILRLIAVVPETGQPVDAQDSLSPVAPFRIVNIGHGAPVGLMDFIAAVEAATGRPAVRRFLPRQPGDMDDTWADPTLLRRLIGPLPALPLAEGVRRFVAWYEQDYAPLFEDTAKLRELAPK